jgi:hypothetical protein
VANKKWCPWGGEEGFGITTKHWICWGCGKRVKVRRVRKISRGTRKGYYRATLIPSHHRS